MAACQSRELVGDVQERLLAHAGVEASVAERKRGRVAPDGADLAVEPDQAVEPRGAGGPAGVVFEGQDAAAAPARQEARRAAEASADVEDVARRRDAGAARAVIHPPGTPRGVPGETAQGAGTQAG